MPRQSTKIKRIKDDPTGLGRCLTARAFGLTPRALLRSLGLTASIAIALGGCDERTRAARTGEVEIVSDAPDGATLTSYIDPVSGCQYLIFSAYNKGSITPRLRADGKPNCPEGDKQ